MKLKLLNFPYSPFANVLKELEECLGYSEIVFDIFKRLTREFNQTMLVVTHDNSFAEKTDRIIEMEDGQIIRQ